MRGPTLLRPTATAPLLRTVWVALLVAAPASIAAFVAESSLPKVQPIVRGTRSQVLQTNRAPISRYDNRVLRSETVPSLRLRASPSSSADDSSNNKSDDGNDDSTDKNDSSEDPSLNTFPMEGSTWKCHNDFQTFLNQCSIQSLAFLMNSLRDRQTAIWLEEFTQPVFHRRQREGTERDQVIASMAEAAKGATPHADAAPKPIKPVADANVGSDTQAGNTPSDAPPKISNVEIKMLSYHGLGFIDTDRFPTWDSFFQKLLAEPTETYTIASTHTFVPNYELEINPASICSRLVSVREQIAREWRKDLDVIADMGGQLMDSYWEYVQRQKSDGAAESTLQRPNLLFLEMPPDSTNDYSPSPLRKGNFDLLTLLTTQESIHRVLNNPDAATNSPAEVNFLRNFYTKRVGTHFTGSQWYGRADDFLEELLGTAPTRVQIQDEETAMVDPLRIVEMILEERERVADEWLEIVAKVPESHMTIKRIQLNKLMGIDESEVRNAFE